MRSQFPTGLEQPPDCARFGMDALLLASFTARVLNELPEQKRGPFLELGCGVGAALLAVALLTPECPGLGLEQASELAGAARNNIALLGLTERLSVMDGVLPGRESLRRCREWSRSRSRDHGDASMVFANPPYWRSQEGRPSPRTLVEQARRSEDALDIFCAGAASLLRHKGFFCCIYDARALPRLLESCARHRLGIRRLLPLHARAGRPAGRILLEARKDAADDVFMEEPLYLHPPAGGDSRWTRQALEFCPFLERSL